MLKFNENGNVTPSKGCGPLKGKRTENRLRKKTNSDWLYTHSEGEELGKGYTELWSETKLRETWIEKERGIGGRGRLIRQSEAFVRKKILRSPQH